MVRSYLKTLRSQNVYVLGVRAQIWAYLGAKRDLRPLEAADAQQLVNLIKSTGEARGLYHYPAMPPDTYDHSISQFGVLGLWALAQDGAEVDTRAWDVMDQAWRRHQSKAGGWAYVTNSTTDEGADTLSMTCAGVATLFITHDYVHAADERGCAGNAKDANIDLGMKWIADNFNRLYDPDASSRDSVTHFYALYGIERIGVAAGYKYFGKTDWFESGSNYLVSHQNPDGSFGVPGLLFGMDINYIPSTSFALLFLANGNAPVVVEKLTYNSILPGKGKSPEPGYWNQRPRDMFNLSHWMAAQTESPLKWNIVTLATPLWEWHESPVLYIAGSMPLSFSDADIAKLRQFVEDGGMILANADCGSKAFTESFKSVCSKMMPAFEFRELPEGHLIYTGQQFRAKGWLNKPRLLGLSTGVRELVLLAADQDPSRVWQVPYRGNIGPYGLGVDIIEYATERTGIRDKRRLLHFEVDPTIATTRSLSVARITYDGNYDPEPGTWRNLAAMTHNLDKIDVKFEMVKLGSGKLNPGAYPLATLTGTSNVKFTDAQWAELKNYVNAGGTVLIDAAGGSTEFAQAMDSGLGTAFGSAANSLQTPVSSSDPIYPPGLLDRAIFRGYAARVLGGSRTPRLRVIKIDNRNAVIFSREDLTNGLVGSDVDGIIGYTPDTAMRIVGNIVNSLAR